MPNVLQLDKRDDGIAVVVMDDPHDAVNTLKRELVDELAAILDELEAWRDLEALVFTSGKPDSFIAGANLDMLKAVRTAEDAAALSRMSQTMQARLEGLKVPTVAAIHGSCLGGGLELALAFDARVASDDDKTRLGLPEVQLGLLPGGGGTQRLPRLVGIQAALDMLLTGRQLSAPRADAIGLVDEVVPSRALLETAIARARAMPQWRPTRPASSLFSRASLVHLLLAGNPIGRHVLFQQARKRTRKRTRGKYPAPERILEVVRVGLEHGLQAGFNAEAEAFGELVVSPIAHQLINIFFATTELKKDSGVDDTRAQPASVCGVGILGAGLMGAGIAYVTATLADASVHLKDRDRAGVDRGLGHVRALLDQRVKRGRMTKRRREEILERVAGATDYESFADLDVVIEAVFEDLGLKQQMVKDIEGLGNAEQIFASNTSSVPIARIAEAAARPQNVVGMHYFSPVPKMPLLEIIITDKTAPRVTATCVALGKRQGKTVIVVHDGPGFYTSRILAPYMNEAAWLLAQGIAIEAVDWALVDFGFPVGPMTLLDEIGIDVGHKVGGILQEAFGERMTAPASMARLIAEDRLGRKSGRGFYQYDQAHGHGKVVDGSVYALIRDAPSVDKDPGEIAERCTLQMVNEAARCLEEGILRSARDGDIGAIFGLGFPPFLGGPFRYVDAQGAGHVVERLRHYEASHGIRFTPAPRLVELAESAGRFYP